MEDSEVLLRTLKTRMLSPQITYLDETESTNLVARTMVENGGGEGIIVIARRQTGGLGRHNRKWFSPVGGLYLSIVLTPPFGATSSPLLGIIMANAAIRALERVASIRAWIKWPNDLFVNDRKLGGIRGELVRTIQEDLLAIVGIGINVSSRISDFPDEFRSKTTTIAKESDSVPGYELLAGQIINGVDRILQEIYGTRSFESTINYYRQNCFTIGTGVQDELSSGIIEGVALDVDDTGQLIVKTEDGIHLISAGEVIHLK